MNSCGVAIGDAIGENGANGWIGWIGWNGGSGANGELNPNDCCGNGLYDGWFPYGLYGNAGP